MNAIVPAYLATWNATDPQERRELLEQHWSPHATYVDPLVSVAGHDQLDATVAAVQQQFPGFVFTAVGDADAHHDQVRFQWGLGPEGAEPVAVGFDVALVDAEGRIRQVLGFLDVLPA